jgi:hypothetical protein
MLDSSDFNQLRAALSQLNLEQAKQLYGELGAIVQELGQQSASLAPLKVKGREVVDVKRVGQYIYQLERIRCGKVGCKCAGDYGELHGPYWYVYWRDEGKLKSRYVGKRFREIPE